MAGHQFVIQTEGRTPKGPQRIVLDAQGGDPWFAYIWINGMCYVIRQIGRHGPISIRKVR